MQINIQLHGIDYAILTLYFVFVLGIGFALKKTMKGSSDIFLSGRSIPARVTCNFPLSLKAPVWLLLSLCIVAHRAMPADEVEVYTATPESYIPSSCHNIQAVTPPENVIAMIVTVQNWAR